MMRMALLLLLVFTCGTALAADTVYINDILRVGVRSEPNSTEAPLAVITSGTQVTVLAHQDGYMQIRTPDGVVGWINDTYTTTELPPRQQLAAMTQQRDQLQAEMAKLKASGADTAQLSAQISDLQQQNAKLQQANSALTTRLQTRQGGFGWLYYALGLVVLFVLGVYLGVRWDKERVAQRFGGLEL